MPTLKAPAGVSSASIGQSVYTVEDGQITGVQPEHASALIESHGFSIAEEPAPKKKASKSGAEDMVAQ